MTAPKRIRLSRAKGWRLPTDAINVARPTIWGNPFSIWLAREAGYIGDDALLARMCVRNFRAWLMGSDIYWMGPESDSRRTLMLANLPALRGHDLACWCPLDQPCHADVLLEIANG